MLSIGILGAVLPGALSAFGSVFMSEMRIHEASRKVFGAEWWFNRLELPVSVSALNAMPRADGHGKTLFRWETEGGAYGAVRVTLSVSNGALDDAPFVTSRVFP
jgi:hypothetical protein